MALDGFAGVCRRNQRGVPLGKRASVWGAWLALNLPFERLISIDLILYGSSCWLEFAAPPSPLPRPHLAGLSKLETGPSPACSCRHRMLIAYALYVSRADKIIGTTSALLVAIAVGLLGPSSMGNSHPALARATTAILQTTRPVNRRHKLRQRSQP